MTPLTLRPFPLRASYSVKSHRSFVQLIYFPRIFNKMYICISGRERREEILRKVLLLNNSRVVPCSTYFFWINTYYTTQVFLSIPYASPPVKSHRFSPTQTPLPWEGIKTAVKPGFVCPQVCHVIIRSV